jgi:hypothetical protein
MKPSLYWLYHIFEKGLAKAETNTPCADKGYHKYINTVTHGAGPITATLDLYGPDKSEAVAEAVVEAPVVEAPAAGH